MKRIVLTFGLIAGAILSVMMVVSMRFIDQIGFDKGEIIGYTTMVLAFLMVYFGVRSYRDDVRRGRKRARTGQKAHGPAEERFGNRVWFRLLGKGHDLPVWSAKHLTALRVQCPEPQSHDQ